MPNKTPQHPQEAGSFPVLPRRSRPKGGFGASEMISLGLGAVWLAVFGWLFWHSGAGGGGVAQVVMVLVALFLPVALILLAALMFRSLRSMRSEAEHLHEMLDTMRQAYLSHAQMSNAGTAFEKRLDEIAATARRAEQAVASIASRRDGAAAPVAAQDPAAPAATESADQPGLALGAPPDAATQFLSNAEVIRALNFPDGPDDREGFRALRHALQDHRLSKSVRAAQDILTLLSQDGIYMDDLTPDRARPELWRRFAQGERGRTLSGLGGIHDRSSLALSADRMRQDTIFRDTAHHFLRQFDRTLADFEKSATDAELAELSCTRSARAFMLLGRVAGVFD
ncbi:hypothetical protein OEW28_00835 [Defluviimonas sp. WL0002]|uniref:Uncharacterized protein n=1 Tax=Albidovulum marisflavi TaxID=2984159 RepID=A0ABT2Z7S3_9RHOB|nr:hypothetical protein [Defluviimonas sp. WL0002]MCV2867170.1 hypothetical protein [Defluviimonas sp. WL0002]